MDGRQDPDAWRAISSPSFPCPVSAKSVLNLMSIYRIHAILLLDLLGDSPISALLDIGCRWISTCIQPDSEADSDFRRAGTHGLMWVAWSIVNVCI